MSPDGKRCPLWGFCRACILRSVYLSSLRSLLDRPGTHISVSNRRGHVRSWRKRGRPRYDATRGKVPVACLSVNVVHGSVYSVCSSESFIRGQLGLHGGQPSNCRGLRSAAGLHDDERGSLVDREPGHHGGRIVDDDYGQDERVEAAL